MSGPVTGDHDAPAEGCHGETTPDVEVADSREAQVGRFTVRRALPRRARRTVGAWCFVDHMGPAAVTEDHGLDVAPHPRGRRRALRGGHRSVPGRPARHPAVGRAAGVDAARRGGVRAPRGAAAAGPRLGHRNRARRGARRRHVAGPAGHRAPRRRPRPARRHHRAAAADRARARRRGRRGGRRGAGPSGRRGPARLPRPRARGVPPRGDGAGPTRDEITEAHRAWLAGDPRFPRVASPLPRIEPDPPPWVQR